MPMIRPIAFGCAWTIILFVVGASELGYAAGPRKSGRTTDDRNADLINELISRRRFDEALEIGRSELARNRSTSPGQGDRDLQDLATASWTARLSEILVARQMTMSRFDDADVEQAIAPVVNWLSENPDSPLRWFVQAQAIAAERAAARFAVSAAAVSPSDSMIREAASKQLTRATSATNRLAAEVASERTRLDASRATDRETHIADLGRLVQELRIESVAMALMQTELFGRQSDDAVVAATKAERAAEAAIVLMPPGSTAQSTVQRFRVEAILRARQPARAQLEYAALTRSLNRPASPELIALGIRVDVANQDLTQAEMRLADFYRSQPDRSPPSIDMDLARLEYLLAAEMPDQVTPWLEAIGTRNGPYVRRRAEAVSLAYLRSSGGDSKADASLVAIQGRDWLRRGDPARAGELLSAAARSDSDPDRALRFAGEAAAAWMSARRPTEAVAVLADVSTAHPAATGAAKAHLQAAVLTSQSTADDPVAALKKLLRQTIKIWPDHASTEPARRWLVKILLADGDRVGAAEVATHFRRDQEVPENLDQVMTIWRDVFQSTQEDTADATTRFFASMSPWRSIDSVDRSYAVAVAMWLDREYLEAAPEIRLSTNEIAACIEFRRSPSRSTPLAAPPDKWASDLVWRLMKDARQHPDSRSAIAQTIDRWNFKDTIPADLARRKLWLGETKEAIEVLNAAIAESPNSVDPIIEAARLLGTGADTEAKHQSVLLWDEVAAGSRPDQPRWIDAKLAAITLLAELGRGDEAARRAKYLLLTRRNLSEAAQEALQRYARRPSP